MQIGTLFAYVVSYLVLETSLTNYAIEWMIFACAAAVFVLFIRRCVPETMPQQMLEKTSQLPVLSWCTVFSPFNSLALLFRDRILVGLTALSAIHGFSGIGFQSIMFSTLASLSYSESQIVLPGAFSTVVYIVASCALFPLLLRIGASSQLCRNPQSLR
eukprot:SAG31_NODE_3486_length_4210_cov_1.754074_6_plen_159_part_00